MDHGSDDPVLLITFFIGNLWGVDVWDRSPKLVCAWLFGGRWCSPRIPPILSRPASDVDFSRPVADKKKMFRWTEPIRSFVIRVGLDRLSNPCCITASFLPCPSLGVTFGSGAGMRGLIDRVQGETRPKLAEARACVALHLYRYMIHATRSCARSRLSFEIGLLIAGQVLASVSLPITAWETASMTRFPHPRTFRDPRALAYVHLLITRFSVFFVDLLSTVHRSAIRHGKHMSPQPKPHRSAQARVSPL